MLVDLDDSSTAEIAAVEQVSSIEEIFLRHGSSAGVVEGSMETPDDILSAFFLLCQTVDKLLRKMPSGRKMRCYNRLLIIRCRS